jgi:hypothetical protein
MSQLDLKFSSPVAQQFFECGKRNILWVTGYGGGKTWAAFQKILLLMYMFPGYRVAVCRRSRTALNRTTKQTFYKVCPAEWITRDIEGMTPLTELYNGSLIYWMNIDEFSEENLRSLEINAAVIDQAEDVSERVYLTLDSRIGRWDKVQIPEDIRSNLKVNKFTGKHEAPTYHILLANVPDEGEFWWGYRRFDDPKNQETHELFESSSTINEALSEENLNNNLSRDQEWVNRWVHAKRGQGSGAIHRVPEDVILRVNQKWIQDVLIPNSRLVRCLDHGASAPTCCLWWASYRGVHVCYREYYQPDQIISYHRKMIGELSGDEKYEKNLIDPSCLHKQSAKYGGFWSITDEYADPKVYHDFPGDAPRISFLGADNNEFATRNRINELLVVSDANKHPITNASPAPGIYFCVKDDLPSSDTYNPHGVFHAYRQLMAQKKEILDTIDGKIIYSDERAKSVEDHAYDVIRYYVADHSGAKVTKQDSVNPRSFTAVRKRIAAIRKLRELNAERDF